MVSGQDGKAACTAVLHHGASTRTLEGMKPRLGVTRKTSQEVLAVQDQMISSQHVLTRNRSAGASDLVTRDQRAVIVDQTECPECKTPTTINLRVW